MKLNELTEFLKEYEVASTLSRPDGSRMGMYRPLLKRPDDFPYDREQTYGQPDDYDRYSAGKGGASHHGLTPKNTKHSIWDKANDKVKEAMGTPMAIGKSGAGSLTGTTPGAASGWSKSPIKDWEEEKDTIDPSVYSRELEALGYPVKMEAEPVVNSDPSYYHDQTDDDLEKKTDIMWGRNGNPFPPTGDSDPIIAGSNFPSDILVVAKPIGFHSGLGGGTKGGRNLFGLGWKEELEVQPERSAWEEVVEFVDSDK